MIEAILLFFFGSEQAVQRAKIRRQWRRLERRFRKSGYLGRWGRVKPQSYKIPSVFSASHEGVERIKITWCDLGTGNGPRFLYHSMGRLRDLVTSDEIYKPGRVEVIPKLEEHCKTQRQKELDQLNGILAQLEDHNRVHENDPHVSG